MANLLTKIPKFRRCVLQNFPFIEQDFDALTDYQLLCKVVEYLNKVINSQNEVITITESLTAAFNELQSFVTNYFDNLDVQEEINNKLDQMAEDGILQEIITTYIQSNVAWTFDTVADMQAATNLTAGSFARTLGYSSLNDGGGAFYKISENNITDSIALSGNLYANLVGGSLYNTNEFDLYGITYYSERYSNGTKYYITHIPYTNKLGLRNELVQGFANDDYGNYSGETARSFANRKNAPFAMNIGLWDTANHMPYGPVIQNGVEQTPSYSNAFSPIGIDADGMVTVYPNGTTATQMINAGVKYGCCAYDELIHNNVVVYDTTSEAWTTTLYQHQIFAQLTNGDYVILTCDGKNYEDQEAGMTYEMLANVLMSKYDNIRTAYACDGGGSASTVVNHEFINVPSDGNFASERAVPVIWYIKPVNSIDNFLNIYKKIGDIENQLQWLRSHFGYSDTLFGTHGIVFKNNNVNERINAIDNKFRVTDITNNKDILYLDRPSHPYEFQMFGERFFALYKIMKTPADYSITDADTIDFPSVLFCDGSTVTNVPDPTIAHIVITLPILSEANRLQIVIPYNTNTDYKAQYRYRASSSWRAWRLFQ